MTTLHARNLIDGRWQSAERGAPASSLDPSSQNIIGRYEASGRVDAEAAVAAARRAFDRPDWAQNPRLRQTVMLKWADVMERRGQELADLLTRENGKPLAQSRKGWV